MNEAPPWAVPTDQRFEHRRHDQGRPAPQAPAPPRAWLGGNIGGSLLPVVDQIAPNDWVVLELSSFQLENLAPLEPRPDVAVVTNFSPNHLDRHGTLERYSTAKQNILRWQTAGQFAVLNQDDPEVASWKSAATTLWFGRDDEGRQGLFGVGFERFRHRALWRYRFREQVLPLGDWFTLPGEHAFANALAAACAALVLGAAPAEIAEGCSRFRGLPHRLERLCERHGRTFYNDSKATTPEAAMGALMAFRAPLVLIAGGYDKHLDLAGFAAAIVERGVRALALVGETGPKIADWVRACDPRRKIPALVHATLPEAFAWAVKQSEPGDVILLSPGCASYDLFENYEERGLAFGRLAEQWAGP